MRADVHALIDACVLANQGVCDLLLSLAERPRLFVPHWSALILEEVKRTHLVKLNWPDHLAGFFQQEIMASFPEAEISKYWESISDTFPNVSALEVIVVDLTLRAPKSARQATTRIASFVNDRSSSNSLYEGAVNGVVALNPR